ncbi:HEAT repeat domain-containing protein [Eudoraea adriatica]|uniref:HEAT repeat domain-containing protein n=1 Tax=Eudoraea adriatica TaxID=446681 RepID=UPI0012FA221F|nr:HEAT repeat domain-containing protein [Eudoraea adriatica]
MKIISQSYHSIMLISAPKIPTDLLWDLTIVFSGLGILLFVFVFIFRNRLSNKALKVASQKKILAPMISNFLFYETDATKGENYEYINLKVEIRELLKIPFNRLVLTEILLDLQKDLSGDSRTRIFKLYQDLELHLDAFKKLRSWRWELVSKGILELTQMKVLAAYGFIKKFINDKRGVVRKQAQIATVTLKHEGISYFLDTTRYGISEWQQLKLLDVLKNFDDFTPPRFKAWLTSANRDVVLFALRLIRHYNQTDANKALIELLKHKNDQIKSEAIQCIKDFGVFEALNMLKSVFGKCNVDIKLQILDAISSLGKEEDLEFLESIKRRESNFLVKSKAISSINVIKPDTYVPTEGIDNDIPTSNFENYEQESSAQSPEAMRNKELQQDDRMSVTEKKENSSSIQDYLNPEFEDAIIFDLCFMEELEDILSDYKEEDQDAEYLPLDFLPVVSEEDELKAAKASNSNKNSGIESNEKLEEESFRVELEAILANIRSHEEIIPDENKEDTELEFLPVVVGIDMEENIEEVSELQEEDILSLEVFSEEVVIENKAFLLQNKSHEVELLPKEEMDDSEISDQKSPDRMTTKTEAEDFDSSTCTNSNNDPQSNNDAADSCADVEHPDNIPEFKGFSIFQELFRTCDNESKLILLDEILAVGDEKEVHFLKTLLNDSDKKVRIKAEIILNELQAHLAPEIEFRETLDQIQTTESGDEHCRLDEAKLTATKEINLIPISNPEEEDSLKSLEFCFLHDLESDDKSNHNNLFQVDFELEETCLEEIDDNLKINKNK